MLKSYALLCALFVEMFMSFNASATPLFNRQTGQTCAACHTAPPELTPFGRRFMLNGYTLSGGNTGIPVSGLIESGFTTTNTDLNPPRQNLKSNNNLEIQRIKISTGGALTNEIGAFAELIYNGESNKLQLGNIDLRYSNAVTLGARDVQTGITINNNPSNQDPWNSTLIRSWPYQRTAAAPIPKNLAILEGPLAQRVMGITTYGFIDDSIYVELGTYGPLNETTQEKLGVDEYRINSKNISGVGFYGRSAFEKIIKGNSFEIGTTAFVSKITNPQTANPISDRVSSLGADLQYQWKKNKTDLSVRANFSSEHWDSTDSQTNGLAKNNSNHLNNYKLTGSYFYDKKYSLSAGYFSRSGSTDPLFFNTYYGPPDTKGFQAEAFVINPFFTPPKWHPGMRIRLGINYTHYTEFDGAASNYDSKGRSAAGNDTFFIFLYSAF